jgi:heptosyltransferase-2
MKIIVRGANWIGDAVMSVPALRALRLTFPDANITLHTKSWAEGIFQDADFIDRILTVEGGSSFRDTLREARRVSAGEYDLSILFTNSFHTAAVARISGVRKRIGYSRDGRGILLTDPIKPPTWEHQRHQSFYYLHLIEELAKRTGKMMDAVSGSGDAALNVNEERRASARSRLQEAGVDLAKPTIGLGVGSTNSTAKRWGEVKYAALATKLARELDANIVLLGSKYEVDVASQVAALSSAELIDLTGTTDLATATAILSEIDLFVSNDMGLAHIAAAVGTKTLVIFGPTNDVTTRPLGEHAHIIRQPVECSPCMMRECPIDHRCMTRIEPDNVFRLVLEMMNA